MADLELIIDTLVDDIFRLYDDDNSGTLDKKETRMFVNQIMKKSGSK